MTGAGVSRRVRVRVQPAWRAAAGDEEARVFLQQRLATYCAVLFAGLGALDAFWLLFRTCTEPSLDMRSFGAITAFALAALAVIWRAVLARRRLSERTLYRVDLCVAALIGLVLATAGMLSPERRATGYAIITQTIFAVFARAFLVPSSGRRTAMAATLSFLPAPFAALFRALEVSQDVPAPVYVIGAILLGAVAIVLATFGSSLIYGLQRQVSDAIQLGQYTLEQRIGEGGIGTVYRAHHVMLRRPTAIKLLRADRVGIEALRRFEREVQHTSQLTHPNTVAVFDYGRSSEGVLYYAMEYLDGLDLEQIVRRHGPLAAGRCIDILAQVCGALQEAHERGIVHRDIKPANIILCEHGGVADVAKVVDFGLVKEITHDADTSSENIVGTPAYVAPETVTNPRATGPAADLYSLGVVGYFLLSGRRPFEGHNAIEVCVQHVTAEPPPLSQLALGIPDALEVTIMRCLRKRPEERFASAAELADALRAVETNDWNQDTAEAWWARQRAATQAAPNATTPTETITIDLEHRP
jgi:eukaryotic-like serine/threonine-protein kinase